MIQWIGHSSWHKPKVCNTPVYRFPLTEEAVMEVAHSDGELEHLSPQAAIACTYRYAFRQALAKTDLNPRWERVRWSDNLVIKAPASTASEGVCFLPLRCSTSRLLNYLNTSEVYAVVEEFIPGEQWEVNGVVVRGSVRLIAAYGQSWQSDGIQRYAHQMIYSWMREAVVRCVEAVQIDNCAFCIEMRQRFGKPVVIECNARPGEDHHHPLSIQRVQDAVEDGSS